MCSILDIDLDHFNFMDDPAGELEQILSWARRPVDNITDRHNHALSHWRKRVREGKLATPSHILHVDEHHDMMDERKYTNMANFMYHAMCIWPECRVHWLVREAIDSPAMWISDESWSHLRRRFTQGARWPRSWPRPDYVSVCASPEFVMNDLREVLLAVIAEFAAINEQAEPCAAADVASRRR
jgi:hypothetical protein